VHLAARGWPILGDATYGEPHDALSRQALHAWRVSLQHPTTGVLLLLEAALPDDLAAFMRRHA
jgi:23S rRNA-/tRNA-specific pseudouridylate synthase